MEAKRFRGGLLSVGWVRALFKRKDAKAQRRKGAKKTRFLEGGDRVDKTWFGQGFF
jgi:hypothetical protein